MTDPPVAPVRSLVRGFLAVVPPSVVLDALAARVGDVRAAVGGALPLRWVPREHWHVTLQFLGPVADVDAVVEAVAAAVGHGAAAEPGLPGEPLTLGGAGAFPSARRATVLWAGLAEGAESVVALAGRVVAATAGLGYAADDRPYRPHVTLARAPRPLDLRGMVGAFGADPIGPAWVPEAVVLVSSVTSAEGARHTEVARIPLRTPGRESSGESGEGA